jgi:hypothetical protein
MIVLNTAKEKIKSQNIKCRSNVYMMIQNQNIEYSTDDAIFKELKKYGN